MRVFHLPTPPQRSERYSLYPLTYRASTGCLSQRRGERGEFRNCKDFTTKDGKNKKGKRQIMGSRGTRQPPLAAARKREGENDNRAREGIRTQSLSNRFFSLLSLRTSSALLACLPLIGDRWGERLLNRRRDRFRLVETERPSDIE